MGYTIDFHGRFELDRELDDDLYTFLCKFNETRRIGHKLPPEFGVDGEFYVGSDAPHGQDRDDNVIPPSTHPTLWCNWTPTDDRKGIEWNGSGTSYNYTEWLKYIVTNFLKPNGYILNGQVSWKGEDRNDIGYLIVIDNDVRECHGEPDMSRADD